MSFKFICDELISADGLNLKMPNLGGNLLFGNKGIITGKKYWEVTVLTGSKVVANSTIHIGIAIKSATKSTDSSYKGIYGDTSFNQNIFPQKIKYTGFNGININDTVGVALNADNGKIKFSINGVWLGDLDTGLPIGSEIFPTISNAYNVNCAVNFGASPFKYNVPDGYVACDSAKCLIMQQGKYYSVKDNQITELGIPTDNTQKQQWFNDYGVNDLKEALLTSDINGNKLIDSLDDKFEVRMMVPKG